MARWKIRPAATQDAVPLATCIDAAYADYRERIKEPLAQGPTDIVLDGSGLMVFGAGEWCAEKHGKSKRRWRKLSIGVDPNSSEIVAHKLTDSDVGDPELVETLLEASGRRL